MRMAELSRRSGVPTATIKYYQREGLLPPGRATARNQASYDDSHLDRLDLVRALRDVAGLSIATIGRVLQAMDQHRGGDVPTYLATAVGALSPPPDVPDGAADAYAAAHDQVDELLDLLGWDVDATSPGRSDLVAALVGVHRHLPGLATDAHRLVPFADAVRRLADHEVPDDYDPGVDPAAVLRFSVLGTLLFEPVILALRRLAHTDRIRHLDHARRRSRGDTPTRPDRRAGS